MHAVRVSLAALFTAALLPAQAQSFVNLNFEAAQIPAEPGTHLPWATAVPGWSHSSGSDTGLVFYGTVHVGWTQWFRLLDAALWEEPLSGRFSLSFASGYNQPDPTGATWVPAYVSQTALIPADAQTLWLTATGPFELRIAGNTIPLASGPGPQWAGDISTFAGQVVELRVVNLADMPHREVVIDDIVFSTRPIPEMGTAAMLLAGLGVLGAAGARRR